MHSRQNLEMVQMKDKSSNKAQSKMTLGQVEERSHFQPIQATTKHQGA
jgi:hypothetical protein